MPRTYRLTIETGKGKDGREIKDEILRLAKEAHLSVNSFALRKILSYTTQNKSSAGPLPGNGSPLVNSIPVSLKRSVDVPIRREAVATFDADGMIVDPPFISVDASLIPLSKPA